MQNHKLYGLERKNWVNLHFERKYSAMCLNYVDTLVPVPHPLDVFNRAQTWYKLWAPLPWRVPLQRLRDLFWNSCIGKLFKNMKTLNFYYIVQLLYYSTYYCMWEVFYSSIFLLNLSIFYSSSTWLWIFVSPYRTGVIKMELKILSNGFETFY